MMTISELPYRSNRYRKPEFPSAVLNVLEEYRSDMLLRQYINPLRLYARALLNGDMDVTSIILALDKKANDLEERHKNAASLAEAKRPLGRRVLLESTKAVDTSRRRVSSLRVFDDYRLDQLIELNTDS